MSQEGQMDHLYSTSMKLFLTVCNFSMSSWYELPISRCQFDSFSRYLSLKVLSFYYGFYLFFWEMRSWMEWMLSPAFAIYAIYDVEGYSVVTGVVWYILGLNLLNREQTGFLLKGLFWQSLLFLSSNLMVAKSETICSLWCLRSWWVQDIYIF